MVNLHMNNEALLIPLQGMFVFLKLLVQSIFLARFIVPLGHCWFWWNAYGPGESG